MPDAMDLAIAAIHQAPLSGEREAALKSVTDAVNGWCGQMIGVAANGWPQFDLTTGVQSEVIEEFEARGGLDVTKNPRARILGVGASMSVLDDDDFIGPSNRDRDPFYEFYRQIDTPYCAMSRIDLAGGGSLVVAALRSARMGPMDETGKARLARLAPHLKIASELQSRIDGSAASIAVGLIEALDFPVFLLASDGRPVGMNAPADRMLCRGDCVAMRFERLVAVHARSDEKLQSAIKQACAGLPPTSSQVLLSDGGSRLFSASVAPLAEERRTFRTGAVAMLAFPDHRDPRGDPTSVLQSQFGLTSAEAGVALDLARAVSPSEIAIRRNVAVSTVRQQIKSLYAKTDTHSRASLVRMLLLLLKSAGMGDIDL